MKRISLLAIVIAASWLCWFGLRPQAIHPAHAQENSKSRKKQVRSDRKQITVFRCNIQLIDTAIIGFDRPGIIEFVEPGEGDYVREDSEVARLHDGVARATLAIAERRATNDINVRFAKAALELANKELERRQFVNRGYPGSIPAIEIEQYKLNCKKSQLSIEQAEEELAINGLNRDEAEEQLKTYSIKAPWDGFVTNVFKQKGEPIRQGDPILEMVSTDRVKVEGYLDIKNAWTVQPGDLVEVQLDIRDNDLPVEREKFEGRIVFVDVRVQAVTQTVRVWAEVSNHGNKLKTGLQAKMTINTREQVAQRADK